MDSEQHSKDDLTNTSERGASEPEEGMLDLERDVEKQSQDQVPPQQMTDTGGNDASIVEFTGPDDPDDPKNWTARRRAIITVSMGLMTFVVTFSSSIFAVAIEPVSKEFDVGIPVATLGVSFFLLVSDQISNMTSQILISTGVRSWPRCIRSSERGMGPQITSLFGIYCFRHLQYTCCRETEHRNDLNWPFHRWSCREFAYSSNWRSPCSQYSARDSFPET